MVYSNRKVEDQLLGYEIQEQGDYEICFNNRYSMLEHKRIFWQFEIEGAFDVAKAEEKLLNATVEFYNEASNQVQKVVRKVCTFDVAYNKLSVTNDRSSRDRPRFFDQVGHQTTKACIGNKHFFTKVRLTKIMNNLFKDLKILSFKVIFQCLKLVKSFQKTFSVKNI